jgi:hypothetical protein
LTGPYLDYATTEKELLVTVFAIEKFRSYLVGEKIILYIYIYHATLKYLFTKKGVDTPTLGYSYSRNLIPKSEIRKEWRILW